MTFPGDHAAAYVEILPVLGIGELRPGDDLADRIVRSAPPLRDGDVISVMPPVQGG